VEAMELYSFGTVSETLVKALENQNITVRELKVPLPTGPALVLVHYSQLGGLASELGNSGESATYALTCLAEKELWTVLVSGDARALQQHKEFETMLCEANTDFLMGVLDHNVEDGVWAIAEVCRVARGEPNGWMQLVERIRKNGAVLVQDKGGLLTPDNAAKLLEKATDAPLRDKVEEAADLLACAIMSYTLQCEDFESWLKKAETAVGEVKKAASGCSSLSALCNGLKKIRGWNNEANPALDECKAAEEINTLWQDAMSPWSGPHQA